MNRITRMLTMTGLGLFAAVSVGAGQAMATTGGTQTPAKPAAPASKAQPSSRHHTLDIYSSKGSCLFAGRLGERLGDWDDFVCSRTGGGYELRISFDTWGGFNNWDNHDWHGPWGIHGLGGGGFRGIGGGFRGNGGGFRGDGGGFRGDGGGFRGNGGGFRGDGGGFRGNGGGFRGNGGGFRGTTPPACVPSVGHPCDA